MSTKLIELETRIATLETQVEILKALASPVNIKVDPDVITDIVHTPPTITLAEWKTVLEIQRQLLSRLGDLEADQIILRERLSSAEPAPEGAPREYDVGCIRHLDEYCVETRVNPLGGTDIVMVHTLGEGKVYIKLMQANDESFTIKLFTDQLRTHIANCQYIINQMETGYDE